jgi:hypothetical protein
MVRLSSSLSSNSSTSCLAACSFTAVFSSRSNAIALFVDGAGEVSGVVIPQEEEEEEELFSASACENDDDGAKGDVATASRV